MADIAAPRSTAIWTGLYIGLSGLIIFGQLLPLQTMPRTAAMPDLILVVTLVWVARKPEAAPLLAVAGVFFMADFLFQRPPGLMTGLVLIGTEVLRRRAESLKAATFWEEWASAAACVAGISAAYWGAHAVFLIPSAEPVLAVMQTVATAAIYPVVVAATWALFGLRRPMPGEARKGLQR